MSGKIRTFVEESPYNDVMCIRTHIMCLTQESVLNNLDGILWVGRWGLYRRSKCLHTTHIHPKTWSRFVWSSLGLGQVVGVWSNREAPYCVSIYMCMLCSCGEGWQVAIAWYVYIWHGRCARDGCSGAPSQPSWLIIRCSSSAPQRMMYRQPLSACQDGSSQVDRHQ